MESCGAGCDGWGVTGGVLWGVMGWLRWVGCDGWVVMGGVCWVGCDGFGAMVRNNRLDVMFGVSQVGCNEGL